MPRLASLLMLAATLAPMPALAADVALDDFLGGFGATCETGPALAAYKRGLLAGAGEAEAEARLAPEIAAALGPATVMPGNEEPGSVFHRVPVTGASFRGLPVKALEIGQSWDYPLLSDSVVFAVAGDTALAALAEELARVDKALGESIVEYTLSDGPDGPVLTCFVTN